MSKQGDSHGTAENDSTEGGAPRAHKRVTKTSARSTSPGSAGLLIQALGLGSLLAGAAVIALPKALPHQAWIAHSAASHGLSSGVLACGGLILLSIGGALRSLIKRIASASESSNAELLLEQLAGDLAQMRVGVQDLRVELVYAKDSLAGIVEHQHAAEEAAAQAGSQEAIFRLAASLDQVGARLDQRIQHGHATLQRSVAEIQQALQSTHEGLTAAISGARSPIAHQGPDSASWGDAAAPETDASESDMHVWVELEQPASNGLGLFDSLDDDGQFTSPAPGRVRMSHRETPPLEMGLGTEPAAPLPNASADNASLSVEEKLEHLKGLLADPRVRAALDSMRRV